MHDHLPARPSLPATWLLVLPTLLIGSLPTLGTWLGPVWPLAQQLKTAMPEWVAAGLPLLALFGVGGYTIFLQWFDRRKYDEMQRSWNGLAEQNGFPPLAEVALKSAPESVRRLVAAARKKGSFVLTDMDAKGRGDLEGALAIDIELGGGKGYGYVRRSDGLYLIHPDLLKIPRA